MSIKVFRAGAQEYGRWVKALIAGEPGSGKTRTSSTWKDPFYASAEGGLMSVSDRRPPATKVTSSQDLQELHQILRQEPDVRESMLGVPVETVIVDTLDEVGRILMKERNLEKHQETFTMQDWGWYGDQLRNIVRAFRNLDMNVIFTCHVKETQDTETGRVTVSPAIQGAFGGEVPGFVDLALLLTARPTTKVVGDHTERGIARILQTYPDTRHSWIKDRSGRLPMEFEVNFEDDYERIYDLIFGGVDASEEEVTVREVEAHVAQAAKTPPPPPPPPKKAAATKKAAPKAEDKPEDPPAAEPAPEPEPAKEEPKEAEPPVSAPPETQDAAGGVITEPLEIPEQQELAPNGVDPETGEIAETVPAAGTEEQASEPAADGEGLVCEECGGPIESQDQAELSWIRFRRRLCRADHAKAKKAKASK